MTILKVKLEPHPEEMGSRQSGIHRVVEAYARYLPDFGVAVASPGDQDWDILAVHAGSVAGADVAHTHGLYWTADYEAEQWESRANADVIANIRGARQVTVPSEWVAETYRRDLRLNPWVIPHGIEWDDWQEPVEHGDYALWNKNRVGDVCDPWAALNLAKAFPDQKFIMTFGLQAPPSNVEVIGMVEHETMKQVVMHAGVYLSTTKETFGIGTLEAMAAGVPVLGFAHGGNLQLVTHGETGYLARVGDFDDLVEGYRYCMEHRDVLGANAREAAKSWTWERAIEKVAQVYTEAVVPERPDVTIVIPTWNYADKVGRAIKSALAQDYELLEAVVVVDDGSDDDGATERLVKELMEKDRRLMYRRQENQGVAAARNAGIAAVSTKYSACLDADDALEPGFLSACVQELEADRALGVAYTRLRWIKPDGSTGISEWPGEFNYDEQLKRQNQIPTACVFRREAWERLGGYRQRYAPGGAGAEDAEFWLRMGAYGWNAKLVKGDPLFIYSWESGRVSGDKDYREPDWTRWHPWAHDGQHPLASVATPVRYAHPVRQYDEPVVSVIIPVGPDHDRTVIDALDSLEAQTFRRWEAIVVWDLEGLIPDQLTKAYPYVRWRYGERDGPGAARNQGAEQARAPFLLFVDADDWLYPEAIERMMDRWREKEGIVYTDYVGKVLGLEPEKLAPDLQSRIYYQDDQEAVIGYQSQNFDCELAQRQPETDRQPYHWCLVTSLVPKAWHDEIGGFDETMESWEDVDYHWRMARAGKCYVRVPEELVVYRFYTGGRRAAGLQSYRTLIEYLRKKYEEVPLGSCNCGGGNGRARQSTKKVFQGVSVGASRSSPRRSVPTTKGLTMSDDDFVMARYLSPNRGGHRVIGASTKVDYGYRKGGDVFLVHRSDVEGQGHLFRAEDQLASQVPGRAPTPAPAPIAGATPTAAPAPIAGAIPTGPPAPIAAGETMPPVTDAPEAGAEPAPAPGDFNLHALPGVTKPVAAAMTAAGIDSFQAIMELGVPGLTQVNGIGKVKAEQIIGAAEKLQAVAARA